VSRLLVVCEAEADFRAARILADRVLLQEVEWLGGHNLDDFRRWVGLDDSRPYLVWKSLRDEVGRVVPRVPGIFGHFESEPGAPDAWAARFVLLSLAGLAEPPDAVVLLRDADGQPERRQGLEQGKAALRNPPFAVVVGLADPKREAWVLWGFRPKTPFEQSRLNGLAAGLGFDPTRDPGRLRGRSEERDIKRVAAALAGDASREDDCLLELAFEGIPADIGLGQFVGELRSKLVPVFSHARAPT